MNKSFTLVSVIGTRPQYVKLAAINRCAKELNIKHEWIDTGQHYSPELSRNLVEELGLEMPRLNLGIGSGTHAEQTAKALVGIEKFLTNTSYSCVLVYGDTNSTLAGALAATKLKIPVAHIEAGLRSGMQFMPEELNRKAVDSISTFLFAPTMDSFKQLKIEGFNNTFFSGDVMFDEINLLDSRDKASEMDNEYILVTIHRDENTSSPERLKSIFANLECLSNDVLIVAHPRLSKVIKNFQIQFDPNKIKIVDSVGRKQLLSYISGAKCVVTDSGGIQKEAYYLKKICITIRESTEWKETLKEGWNILNPNLVDLNTLVNRPMPNSHEDYFGNGNASKFILETLRKELS